MKKSNSKLRWIWRKLARYLSEVRKNKIIFKFCYKMIIFRSHNSQVPKSRGLNFFLIFSNFRFIHFWNVFCFGIIFYFFHSVFIDPIDEWIDKGQFTKMILFHNFLYKCNFTEGKLTVSFGKS